MVHLIALNQTHNIVDAEMDGIATDLQNGSSSSDSDESGSNIDSETDSVAEGLVSLVDFVSELSVKD